MSCVPELTVLTLASAYSRYRNAASVGMVTVAKGYKKMMADIMLSKYTPCSTPKAPCVQGCETNVPHCVPTITEYNEIKDCILEACIVIKEIE